MNLKPSEELQVSALAAAIVYGIFQLNTPNLSDVRAAKAGNANVHTSVKTAAWTAAVVTGSLALLAKSPTIYVVGGLMIAGESWKFYHANATEPGKKDVTMALQGQPSYAGS